MVPNELPNNYTHIPVILFVQICVHALPYVRNIIQNVVVNSVHTLISQTDTTYMQFVMIYGAKWTL